MQKNLNNSVLVKRIARLGRGFSLLEQPKEVAARQCRRPRTTSAVRVNARGGQALREDKSA